MTAPKDVTVPIPATDSKAEHDQVRHSNDRDQQLERDGKTSRHNEGYDDATLGQTQREEHSLPGTNQAGKGGDSGKKDD